MVVGKHTKENVFGHIALAINGTVFSFGTNWTKGANKDWGASLKKYLDAQASLRETEILTLGISPELEQELLEDLRANNPYSKDYDVVTHSCVTVCSKALGALGLLKARIFTNAKGEETVWEALTPAELAERVRDAGLVTDSDVVGSEATSWWRSLLNTIVP